jgi:hypothetical protein
MALARADNRQKKIAENLAPTKRAKIQEIFSECIF